VKKLYGSVSVVFFLLFGALNVGAAEYLIIGWNDLGMHCANKYFGKIAVLPPYNNLNAQVIRRGTADTSPKLMDSFDVTYEIPGNTYSVGKTDFWTYANQLFNVTLAPNVGLTGLGLTGPMTDKGGYYRAEGIPVTPYTDNDFNNEDPFQFALMKVYDPQHTLLASTRNVIPVSNEISCVGAGCHGSENEILAGHNEEHSQTPAAPVLCAWCHSSNALGAAGQPGIVPLSQAIHGHHAEEVSGITCYHCHPGKVTKCLRDTMSTRGFVCENCHGNLANVASTIRAGRQPWLQEPQCGNAQCHGLKGPQYAEEPGKLFRVSRGHGGLFCSACHGSPHAIVPTRNAQDNQQNIALQGMSGTLRKCAVCHGVTPTGAGPHGILMTPPTAIVTPTNFTVSNPSTGNGHTLNLSWDPSSSENDGWVKRYRIFRSRSSTLTDPIPLSQFTSADSLLAWEAKATILIDSVAVGVTHYTDTIVMITGAMYSYWIQAVGVVGASKLASADTGPITKASAAPALFRVEPAYPNPFNPSTTIRFSLPTREHVRIVVYDAVGRKVVMLADRSMEAGAHDAVWNGRSDSGETLGSGLYLYRFEAGSHRNNGKMLLLR
jgi:hypothetical protein